MLKKGGEELQKHFLPILTLIIGNSNNFTSHRRGSNCTLQVGADTIPTKPSTFWERWFQCESDALNKGLSIYLSKKWIGSHPNLKTI